MYGLGLDKLSVGFLEWKIGKMEAAKFCDQLFAYIIWTHKNGFEISAKLKTDFIHILYIDANHKGCHRRRGKRVPKIVTNSNI